MTLPPHRVGDKGQRYEVRASEDGAERAIGWSGDRTGAEKMAAAWKLRGPHVRAWVVDRKPPARTGDNTP